MVHVSGIIPSSVIWHGVDELTQRHILLPAERGRTPEISKKIYVVDYGPPLLRMGRLLTRVLKVSSFNLSSPTPVSIGNHLARPRRSLMSSKSQVKIYIQKINKKGRFES